MEKYIEIKIGKQVDRYHLINVSVDEFIDTMLTPQGKNVKQVIDITKEDFETHVNSKWHIDFNVEDKFEVRHYVKEHINKRLEREWNKLVQEIMSDGSLY